MEPDLNELGSYSAAGILYAFAIQMIQMIHLFDYNIICNIYESVQ